MISSKLGAIAFVAAIGVASPAFAQTIYNTGFGAGGPNNLIAIDYTYNARPGWPVRNPNPWANDYRLKHHHVTHHLPSKAQ
jgi:hypothetical protein